MIEFSTTFVTLTNLWTTIRKAASIRPRYSSLKFGICLSISLILSQNCKSHTINPWPKYKKERKGKNCWSKDMKKARSWRVFLTSSLMTVTRNKSYLSITSCSQNLMRNSSSSQSINKPNDNYSILTMLNRQLWEVNNSNRR